ncbi:uncharacterized protein LOC114712303 [Neltuma alba]|uniref:uncharacterized protein LOC114712303 n=1 Tax=Neltuma alba TaxID=207710 RepID=UPI0010A3D488|nr:uncharacterized protein LOC114712303 [Prosopis alba]
MRTKRGGTGFIAIKVDMEKAYDRLDWNFLEFTMKSLGLSDNFVDIIMKCISTASMRVLWNGVAIESFQPSRGVRQGDPLSPYLFVLCMERLGQLIQHEIERGRWKPMKLSTRGPIISHLFFADDLILFGEASTDQMLEMKNIMHFFCQSLRTEPNGWDWPYPRPQKVFGCTDPTQKSNQDDICSLNSEGEIKTGKLERKIPEPSREISTHQFGYLNTPLIPNANNTTPKRHLVELEKISRTFFWNNENGGRKLHLLAWDVIKKSKEEGGLGIKDLHSQNVAFIMKLCWGILTKPQAMWVKCLKAKYDCGENRMPEVNQKRNQSEVWRAITLVWKEFLKGVGFQLQSGETAKAWSDLWSPLELPLKFYANKNFHQINPDEPVRNFVTDNGQWNLIRWGECLPSWVLEKIKMTRPPTGRGEDKICLRNATDGNFSVWLKWNTENNPTNGRFSRWPWSRIFEQVCWAIWKNRCKKAFGEKTTRPKDQMFKILNHLMEEVQQEKFRHQIYQLPERSTTQRNPPPPDYVRIDVDGSKSREGAATCGGFISDYRGHWKGGFQRKLGTMPSTAAEIHAMLTRLQLCKQLGYSKIKLYTDSAEALHLLLTDCEPSHPLREMVQDLRNLIFDNWDIEILHSFRENLGCANKLATMAHHIEHEYIFLQDIPNYCREYFDASQGQMGQ